jgi:hypothetical protein
MFSVVLSLLSIAVPLAIQVARSRRRITECRMTGTECTTPASTHINFSHKGILPVIVTFSCVPASYRAKSGVSAAGNPVLGHLVIT